MKATSFVALKAQMGTWQYYICRMSFSEAVEYLKFAEQVRPYEDLDTLLQRELSKRANEIAEFLEKNDERFFGSLIVAVYGGSPKFSPIEIEGAALWGNRLGSVGVLNFDGKERYYVLDGQHRLAAMRDVAAKNAERYAKDEVSIILVSHPESPEGIQRARRLFTNVNRYAVKTNKATNIALDEDDPLAILTRRLVREDDYFRNITKIGKKDKAGMLCLVTGEALQAGADKHVLMTLPTLYECNRNLLAGHSLLVDTERQQRPSEESLEGGWIELCRRWKPILEGVSQFSFNSDIREFHRNKQDGGDLIARPIAQKAICLAAGNAYKITVPTETIINAINRVPRLSGQPWKGLLWNPENGTMFAGKERMDLAARILNLWMGGQDNIQEIENALRVVTSGTAQLPP
jgi:DNA sulfur modification protein DndB